MAAQQSYKNACVLMFPHSSPKSSLTEFPHRVPHRVPSKSSPQFPHRVSSCRVPHRVPSQCSPQSSLTEFSTEFPHKVPSQFLTEPLQSSLTVPSKSSLAEFPHRWDTVNGEIQNAFSCISMKMHSEFLH